MAVDGRVTHAVFLGFALWFVLQPIAVFLTILAARAELYDLALVPVAGSPILAGLGAAIWAYRGRNAEVVADGEEPEPGETRRARAMRRSRRGPQNHRSMDP